MAISFCFYRKHRGDFGPTLRIKTFLARTAKVRFATLRARLVIFSESIFKEYFHRMKTRK